MSTDHNRIKVADLEKNQPNKILTTNTSGELEFRDINDIKIDSYNALDYTIAGKALDARQGKILKDLVDNINTLLASDNINLKTLQELVDAIEAVQNSLNTIFVNDLSTGGTTKALTAEMGKLLQTNKVDKIAGKNLVLETEITRLSTLSNYSHPANHSPNIITQDASNRFVTDAEKATWNAKQSSLGFTAENVANKNVADGYAGLGTDGKLIASQLPSITVNDTFVIASQTAMLALTAQTGDIAVRTDLNKSFILKGSNPNLLTDWQELLSPTSAVTTVFGRNAAVTALAGDYNADQITETGSRRFQTPNQQAFNDATSSIQTQLNDKQAKGNYEPAFSKNTAFNKNFGTSSGTITEGNDSRLINGQTAFGWGNHEGLYRPIGYVPSWSEISSKPTTLSGFGITDALSQISQDINVNSLSLGTGLYRGSTGSWTNRPTAGHNGGALLTIDTHPGNYYQQLFFDTANNQLRMRSINAGNLGTWQQIFHDGNFNPANYLPLTGGTLSGALTINSTLNVSGLIYGNGKQIFNTGDSWLRINETGAFGSGIYFGSSITRTDGELQVGSNGSTFKASANGLTYQGNNILHAANVNSYAWANSGSWKPSSLSASTRLIGSTSPDGGEFGLAYSGGQIHPYSDGFFYQNEGQYRVIDSNSIGNYSVGNFQHIADYNSDSTWNIRSSGNFIWANAHDWSQSFKLLLPTGGANNNTWAYLGQQQSNATNGNFRGIAIRKCANGVSTSGDLDANLIYGNTFYASNNNSFSWQPNISSAHRLNTQSGYLDIGPMNSSFCHFQTDRPTFYFGKNVEIDGTLKRYGDNAIYLHASNYNSYSPTLTGAGASGTWGINITGSSSNATTVGGIATNRIVYGDGSRGKSTSKTNGNADTCDDSNSSGFYFGSSVTGMPDTNWWSWMNVAGDSWSGSDGYGYQMASSFWSDDLRYRRLTSGGWNNWKSILHSGNYSSYSAFSGAITGASLTVTGDVTAFSDSRVKENIRPIKDVIKRIQLSRGVIYDRIDNKQKDNIGFIAQELEATFPELVLTQEDGTKAVKYQNAVAVLFEAIKDQQLQIESQDKKLKFILKHLNLTQ